MVLKGVNLVHNAKIRSYGLERSQSGTECIESGQMVLQGINWANWVHNTKSQVIWS